MSKKRLRAVIVAVLLAFALSTSLPSPAAPPAVLADVCDSTAGGGG